MAITKKAPSTLALNRHQCSFEVYSRTSLERQRRVPVDRLQRSFEKNSPDAKAGAKGAIGQSGFKPTLNRGTKVGQL
jgi:hypothetical protein